MSFRTELNSLASRDFDNTPQPDRAQLGEWMNQSGRFTLDDGDNLVVINPPERRDGGFVRFFKGLFNSAYQAEQRMLDRMEVLGNNATFAQMLRRAYGSFNPDFAWSRAFNASINRIQSSPSIPLTLTTADLRSAATTATQLVSMHSTDLENYEFKIQALTKLSNLTRLPSFEALMNAVGTHALAGRNMENILTEDECTRFNVLISTNNPDMDELQGLWDNASQNVVTALSSFSDEALKQRADKIKVAVHIGRTLIALGRGNQGPGDVIAKDLSDPTKFAQQNPATAPSAADAEGFSGRAQPE